MPDRLRAGLQFLVLTMLVRIQLGQPQEAEKPLYFEWLLLFEDD